MFFGKMILDISIISILLFRMNIFIYFVHALGQTFTFHATILSDWAIMIFMTIAAKMFNIESIFIKKLFITSFSSRVSFVCYSCTVFCVWVLFYLMTCRGDVFTVFTASAYE